MKMNWGLTETLITLGVVVIGWGVSVEVRMAQHQSLESVSRRIENIEDLMLPVLVDFKTRQELEKRLSEQGLRRPPREDQFRAQEERKAQSWAKEALQRPQMQMGH